jgi:hypothetical protein
MTNGLENIESNVINSDVQMRMVYLENKSSIIIYYIVMEGLHITNYKYSNH